VTSIQYYGTGRRKNATARVFLRPGGGEIKVNDRSLDEYFKRESLKLIIRQVELDRRRLTEWRRLPCTGAGEYT